MRQPDHRHRSPGPLLPPDRLGHDVVPLLQKGPREDWHLRLQPLEQTRPEFRVRLDRLYELRRHFRLLGPLAQPRPNLPLHPVHLGPIRVVEGRKDAEGIAGAEGQLRGPPYGGQGVPIGEDDLRGTSAAAAAAALLLQGLRGVDCGEEFSAADHVVPHALAHVLVHGRQESPRDPRERIQEEVPDGPERTRGPRGLEVVLAGGYRDVLGGGVSRGQVRRRESDPSEAVDVKLDCDEVGTNGRYDPLDLLVGFLGQVSGSHERHGPAGDRVDDLDDGAVVGVGVGVGGRRRRFLHESEEEGGGGQPALHDLGRGRSGGRTEGTVQRNAHAPRGTVYQIR
mmetsp:Transcript_10957/g.22937  ORF Transcript_10957/g.22937 Transcript_10957/m.22937 type:complete len:339 (+) Transcript_10957:173-1189(+)